MVNFGHSKFFDESVKVAGKIFPVENQEYKTRASAIIRSIQLTSSKVIPNAFADGIEGIVVCPSRRTPCKLSLCEYFSMILVTITFKHFKREVKRLRPMTYYTEDELVDMYTQCGFSFLLENNCETIANYLDNHQV